MLSTRSGDEPAPGDRRGARWPARGGAAVAALGLALAVLGALT